MDPASGPRLLRAIRQIAEEEHISESEMFFLLSLLAYDILKRAPQPPYEM